MLAPGLHRLAPEDYHRDPAPRPSLSSTLARLILDRSPLHAWTAHPRLNPAWEPVEKKVFDIGRAIHRAVLGRGGDYVAYPPEVLASNGAASTAEAKAWAAEQRAAGRTVLKAEEVDEIGAVAASVSARLAAMGMRIDPADAEVAALAEVDGVWCRCMADYAPRGRGWLLDLKSTTDASPEACIAAVARYGYDVQAAHYLATWEAATGERRRFRLAFVEKAPPYEVSVVELHDEPGDEGDWMQVARERIAHARRVWRDCLDAGSWPGYPARIGIIGAPAWHAARWAEQGTRDWAAPPKPAPDTLRAAYAAQAPERTA